jgi:hypothetical protein
MTPRTPWRKAGGPRRMLAAVDGRAPLRPRPRPCATWACPEPAAWEIVSQSPRMAAPGFYPVCDGCHDRIAAYEASHPSFNPSRHARLPS